MTLNQTPLEYLDLQVQKDELARQLDEIQSQSLARKQEEQRLSLFYQHELQRWLNQMHQEKAEWQQKRADLASHCMNLQKSLQSRWSSSHKRLHQEKERYCKVIAQLLPEWQRAVERQQMQEIAEYESRASLIKQRRHSADIAFEKEKKLLSLLSIRKQEIEKLQQEEQQDALIRNEERKSISMQHGDLEDTLRSTRYHSFADVRFQEYVIRKEVTSEMERKFSAQIDDIKSQFLRKRHSIAESQNERSKDLDGTTATKSTGNSTEPPEYVLDDHRRRSQDQHRSVSFVEEEDVERDREEKQEMVRETEPTLSIHDEEGIETQRSAKDYLVEEEPKEYNAQSTALSVLESQQNINEQAVKRRKVESQETTVSTEADSLDSAEFAAKRVDEQPALSLPVLSSDSESNDIQENAVKTAATDTSLIEHAVGLIEIDHGKRAESETKPSAAIQISITSENAEEKMYQSPKVKAQPQSQLKLKRSFRARSSRNRLQFSVLASPTQNSEDAIGSVTHNVAIPDGTDKEKKESATKISAKNIHSLNDFDDEHGRPDSTQTTTQSNDSSADEFDF